MSHRHPTPGDVKTTDAPRLTAAFVRCLERLMGDLRLEAPYQAWLVRRHIARLERNAIADSRQADAVWQALYRIPDPDEITSVDQVLRGMGVPWPWVAPALVCAAFPVTRTNSFLPVHEHRGFATPIQMDPSATTGRLPTKDGEAIRRGVDYWYRWKIKQPADALHELEAEELARTGQTTISRRHSTIIQKVQQAEHLLSIWQVTRYRPPRFSK